jgi:hypothetical protein
VFIDFAPLGTPSNAAIQKYMNQKQVLQLFVGSGASRWADPEHFPWTIGLQPSYRSEARIYATCILQNVPGKTIGVLYQNDDFGKDLRGVPRSQRATLGLVSLRVILLHEGAEALQVLVEVLKRCGDNLTRENVMKQVANLDITVDTCLPGVRVKTSPTDFAPIEQLQMIQFKGDKWETFGPLIDSHQE